MDQIEIIVTKPDTVATPSTSSSSSSPSPPNRFVNEKMPVKTTTPNASKPQLEHQFNSKSSSSGIITNENHTNRLRHHHPKANYKQQPSVIMEQNNEKENGECDEEDESKNLLPSSSSTVSLHQTPSKKVSIVSTSSASHSRLKPNYRQLDSSSLSGNTTAIYSSSSAEPSSTTSPTGSPLPPTFSLGTRPKQYHSMRSVRSGNDFFFV